MALTDATSESMKKTLEDSRMYRKIRGIREAIIVGVGGGVRMCVARVTAMYHSW